MALNTKLVDSYIHLLRRRGRALAAQARVVAALLAKAPVDMRGVLGPVLVLAQGVAKAQGGVLAWLMGDGDYPAAPIAFRGYVAAQAQLWRDLFAFLANVAFQGRLPAIEALVRSTPSASLYGANARGVAIGTSLESVLNTAAVAGIGLDTFWTSSATGRAALGRGLAMDPVLTRAYDFDPLTEAILALTETVPKVPDDVTIIRQIERVRPSPVVEKKATRVLTRTVSQGLDLASLAQEVFGHPDSWRLLVAFNTLRYPYLSDDPLVQFGDPQGVRVLSVPTTAGGRTIRVTDVSGLYRDQRLRLDDGTNAEVRTILSVLAATNEVEFSEAVSRVYAVTAVVTIYPPSYDVVGRVLRPGESLLVPIFGREDEAQAIVQRGVSLSSTALYGADVNVTDQGRLVVENGDLKIIEGAPNLVQALRNRFHTPRGSLPHHPDYGFGVTPFIGFKHDGFFNFFAVVEGRQTALRDPRIERVEDFSAVADGDTILLDFKAVTKAEEQFPAMTITAPMRA